MVNNYNCFFFTFLISISAFAQVGIGTVNPKGALDITASSQSNPSFTDGTNITTTRYALNADNFTGNPNNAFQGPYYLSGKGYIPLNAGVTYNIDLIGFINTPRKGDTKGWRVEFGGNDKSGNAYSRFQIVNFN